ncbi:MAG: riboflavin biosynthesis protein RibF [Prevotellaceae bacterium]|jgi:riboflavin kinase/FMN adenylyltransferase|nr:riboflavin biosynthesis protein RibF [Prevotellaceae bacterium]
MEQYIATTGFFDGVHRGHASVLNRLTDIGKRFDLPVAVVTFWPHPRIVLNKDPEKLGLLLSVEEKKQRIQSFGIDRLIVIPFTKEFSRTLPAQFIDQLVQKHGVAGLCIGYDHHTGSGGSAGYSEIRQICEKRGIYCERIAPLFEGETAISSDRIRKCLIESRLEAANQMLGYSYFLTGTVVHGRKLGRAIGFPTANIAVDELLKLIPADGVYSVSVDIDSQRLKGMLYVGKKYGEPKTYVEVNIFDFQQEIYGKKITVHFERFMRENVRFEDINEMKIQLEKDKQQILNN